jgi:hypothetical protein
MIPQWWAPLLLALLVGCGTSTRVVRLNTGRGGPIVYTPRSDAEPAQLGEEEFEEAVQKLGRDTSVSTSPREAALRLFADSSQPRAYAHVRARLGVVSVEEPRRGRLLVPEEPVSDTELASAYGRWCTRRGSSGDCLHLLEHGPTLDEEARRTLAFHIALDSVWDETAEALKDLTSKEAMIAMLSTTGAVYFGLWLLPEPMSKGVAAILTAGLIAYLGWDTVWSLIQGFRTLAAQVKVATSFDELREAGERYGAVMGKNAARVFVMLAMAALGSTAQTMAAKFPTLPGSAQASLVGAEHGGFRLAAVGEVEAVAVSSGGVVTIALGPGAVAVEARGTSAAATEGVDAQGYEHHIATNKWWDAINMGGPWSPRFKKLFNRAGMSLDDAANKVRIKGHKGPHPEEYHREVFKRLNEAMEGCSSLQQCRESLTHALRDLAVEISTPGTKLNKLVTRT